MGLSEGEQALAVVEALADQPDEGEATLVMEDEPVCHDDRHPVLQHAAVQLSVLGAGQPGCEPAGGPQVTAAN
jgi:hypothetical protein